MMWPIFWPDDIEFNNPANTRHPSQDDGADDGYIGEQVAAVVSASARRGPGGYAILSPGLYPRRAALRGRHPGNFGFAGVNGRTLADNAPEAMLSLVLGPACPPGSPRRRRATCAPTSSLT